MRANWMLAALCATSLTAISAQDPATTRERIEKEVAEKQRLMREGKVVRSNVRVTVRLDNGSRLRGVVKNGRFIERHDGLAFMASERVGEDSGLRIWYYDQTNSFIFLPWSTIDEHTIGEILTDERVAQMGLEFDRKLRAEKAGRAVAQDAEKAKATDKPAAAGGGDPADPVTEASETPEAPESPLSKEEQALLAEFPPKEGWNVARLKEIELRKVQIHIYPNEKEQRFLDNFGAWNAANQKQQAFEAEQQSKEPGPKIGTPVPGGRGASPAPAKRGGSVDPKPGR